VNEVAKPRCYVASALGFTDEGRAYYYETFLPALARVVEVVDPWTLTTYQEYLQAYTSGHTREWALLVAQRNADAIRSCSLLAAHLNGQELDCGTAGEVGFASALGLKCFGIRNDLRANGEPGVTVNLQIVGFIYQSGGVIVSALEDLVNALGDT
jgi:nucleoside 2-deoxyribosyltransferase